MPTTAALDGLSALRAKCFRAVSTHAAAGVSLALGSLFLPGSVYFEESGISGTLPRVFLLAFRGVSLALAAMSTATQRLGACFFLSWSL